MSLPVLLSIPHGGSKMPSELQGIVCATPDDIFEDGDAHTLTIYNIGSTARHIIKTEVARAFVDQNRSLHEMAPHNPDGLIKATTCYGRPIYDTPLSDTTQRQLVSRYYMPYHRAIQIALRDDIQLCIDCHSMADVAPVISPDGSALQRPLFCLSDRDGQACPREATLLLADCIAESFGIPRRSVRLDDPFKGGHIVRTYGNNPLPWIQLEMNRSLYMTPEWLDDNGLCKVSRLHELRSMFEGALHMYFDKATPP